MIRARVLHTAAAVLLLLGAAQSCVGSTGGELVDFEAYAAGPEGLTAGEPYVFETDRGFEVELEQAMLHVGGVYLNRSVPTSVASDTSCYLSGTYVAEVTEGRDVDVLDPSPQPFPARGFGTSERARTAEVWLSGGPIDAANDPTLIARVRGVARRGAEEYPFEGNITISENRKVPPPDPALPGAKPICKQRIVTPIEVDLRPEDGGTLALRIDPAGWFQNVDFAALEQTDDDPPSYRFRDDGEDQPSRNLFSGIRANAGVYRLSFE